MVGSSALADSNVRSKLQVDVGHKDTSLSGVSHPLLMSSMHGF
jgi:hypothetical protein